VTYLDEAAAILRNALEDAETRYRIGNLRGSTPESRQEFLDARLRIAEGFARLHEAGRTAAPGEPDAGQETGQ
jgi:hypothetical protein